jgi:hypothetical protein
MEEESPRLNWVKLNVGGCKMITTRDTLTRRDPSSVLARMFQSGLEPSVKDEDNYFLLDRSPKPFEALLLFLRSGAIDSSVIGLKEEATFWGVTS